MNLKKLAYGQTAGGEVVNLYTLTSAGDRRRLDKMLWEAREFEGIIPPMGPRNWKAGAPCASFLAADLRSPR